MLRALCHKVTECAITSACPCNSTPGVLQHESLALLKEMLFALDMALYVGTPADKKAADRLQRRCSSCSTHHSFLS